MTNDEAIILHIPIKENTILNLNEEICDSKLQIPKPYNISNYKNNKLDNCDNIINIDTKISEENNNLLLNDNIETKFNDYVSNYNSDKNVFINTDKIFPIFTEFNNYNVTKKWPNKSNIDCSVLS